MGRDARGAQDGYSGLGALALSHTAAPVMIPSAADAIHSLMVLALAVSAEDAVVITVAMSAFQDHAASFMLCLPGR